MPATTKGKRSGEYVLGVDGCRNGWVAVALAKGRKTADVSIRPDFGTLLADHATAAMIIVDMPIGFPDAGRRACEAMARGLLKPKRHSSVFPTPRRPMLGFENYEEANAWGKAQADGGGLPKQTWMIMPKIREIDALLSPEDQPRIAEGHPEVAFHRLGGDTPCAHPKKSEDGAAERLTLLRTHGLTNAEALVSIAKDAAGAGVARDDVYDACALALTARARLKGKARHLTDGARDARGLRMEIWG
ncbi:MAG: DUF429 domain-containing protein [Pseudomonadota bacterium]